jgi:prepilin-type N-terminal cleavage/methylation domain-containing protein
MGFTLLEIMIVVAIIGLLAAIAIPSFMKARTTSQQKACINNLRQIESGKEQWALEAKRKQNDASDATAINEYLKKTPFCPAGGTYSYNVIGTDAACSMTYPIAHRL